MEHEQCLVKMVNVDSSGVRIGLSLTQCFSQNKVLAPRGRQTAQAIQMSFPYPATADLAVDGDAVRRPRHCFMTSTDQRHYYSDFHNSALENKTRIVA